MGHFSHTCSLTGLPITGGDDVVLVPFVPRSSAYDNEMTHLRKFGTTYMCSNDATRIFFLPCMFPIKGKYDDYGGLEDIVETDATKIAEEHFGLSIQEVVNIMTCGRKDDGYSDALDPIRDETKQQRDEDGDLAPNYKKKFEPLLRMSAMWVRREIYDQLESISSADEYDKIDLGNPKLLESFGFKEMKEKGTDERYNRQFKKGKLIVNSDGTWINVKGESIYTINQFATYCERMKEPLDEELTKSMNKQSAVGQVFDVVIPKKESLGEIRRYGVQSTADEEIAHFEDRYKKDLADYAPDVKVPEDATLLELCDLAREANIITSTRHLVKKAFEAIDKEQKEKFDTNKGSMKALIDKIAEEPEEDNWMTKFSKEDGSWRKFGIDEDNWEEFVDKVPGAEAFFHMICNKRSFTREDHRIARYLMDTSEHYDSNEITNKLTDKYFQAIKDGKNLKQDAVEFSFLDRYLYVLGKFYQPAGTAPQDGAHKDVYNILKLATSVLKPYVEERIAERDC
jgi:hypothetical protein